MDLKTIRDEVRRLSTLVDGWSQAEEIPAVERDLALEKLRNLYEAVRFADPVSAYPENAASDDSREAVLPESIDLGEVLSLDGFPELTDSSEEPMSEEVSDTHSGAVPESTESTFEAGPESVSEPTEAPIFETGPESVPEPQPISVEEPEPISDFEPVSAAEPEVKAAAEPIFESEPEAAFESEPEVKPEPEVKSEPEFEPEPELEPEPESESIFEEIELGSAPTPIVEPALAPTSGPDPTSAFEVTSDSTPSFEEKPDSIPEPEVMLNPVPAPDPISPPTPEIVPAASPRPQGAPTLFGLEDEERVRHRHKQRVIMSLYDPNPVVETVPVSTKRPEPKQSATSNAVPSPAVSSFSRPQSEDRQPEVRLPESVSESVSEFPAFPGTPGFSEQDSAIPTSGSSGFDPVSSGDSSEVRRFAEPEVGTLPGGAVLGEVINHDVQTLADTIAPPRDVASELRRSEPVTDLRKAIGLNDKFLLIRDLFGGDGDSYERAIETLNEFEDFDDCMIFIAEHYAWNPNSDGAKLMMDLLERKFA